MPNVVSPHSVSAVVRVRLWLSREDRIYIFHHEDTKIYLTELRDLRAFVVHVIF